MVYHELMQFQLPGDWQESLALAEEQSYFKHLEATLAQLYQNTVVFPPAPLIFNALGLTSLANLKVVILGQDPYHGVGQAHGLAFSVPATVRIPPSLKNIYKEIASDTGRVSSTNGSLEHWAKQGVLLLNSTLTVEENQPGSHKNLGWETFTNAVIENISKQKEHVVFILWGTSAYTKASLIDETKHLILKSAHPSPLSAYRGFFGSKPFSATNAYLKKHGLKVIVW